MVSIRNVLSISQDIRALIQKETYEKIICDLMNESTILFPNKYRQVTSQSNGECDFVDMNTGKKYDAKMLFSNKQCQLIARGIDSLANWVGDILDEIADASQRLLDRDWTGIRNTSLYKEMIARIRRVADDENCILFIPFPIVPTFRQSTHLMVASDIVSVSYKAIAEDCSDCCLEKEIVMIYTSPTDQRIVLRDLKTMRKEYLPIDRLSPYITFKTEFY